MSPELTVTIILAVYVGVFLILGAVRGRFSAQAFAHLPADRGPWTASILLIGLGGWLVMGMVGLSLVQPIAGPDNLSLQWLGSQLGGLVVAVGLLVFAARSPMHGLGRFGITFDRPIMQIIAILVGMLFVIPATVMTLNAVALTAESFGYDQPDIAHQALQQMLEAPRDQKLILIFSAVFLAPFIEEILFRGLVQSTLIRLTRGRKWLAILIAGALFAGIHFNVPWITMPGLFVLGIGMGYLYERTGSLWPPIFIHMAFNALNVWITLQSAG